MNDKNRMNAGAIAGELAQQMIERGLSWSDAIGISGWPRRQLRRQRRRQMKGSPENSL